MFATLLVVLYIAFRAAVVAQSSLSVVCVAGQCFQGFSNITIGAKLSAPGAPASILLLPGQYTSTTNPQLLHSLLTSSSATLVGSPGFQSSSLSSLPLNLQLEPGVAVYPQSLYSGQAAFSQLPASPLPNTSTPLAAASVAISSNVWVAVSSNNNRLILWDSVPDTSQLPSVGSLSLLDIQSSACSPPCSGSGICSASGTCTCPTGFTGSSCESCAQGFFGPTCQPCPQGCSNCDQGISGSGRCLAPIIADLPSTCNCLNGKCGTNGQCTCNPGWTTGDNGTACAKCATGFFLTTTGDCQVCQLGCSQCTDGSGTCISCRTGFTQDANDKTKCDPIPSQTADGVRCPDGSFSAGAQCSTCSPSCRTCNGPSSNDCTLCATGSYLFNGNCVSANSDGVCQGTNGMIADNNKNACDTCGAKCTSCRIPNFSVASTVNQLQCTGCVPGSFLSQGKCIASCPAGTFVSPQDNVTCTACSSSCSTCAGSADFCLTCPSSQLASSGKCVSTCPSKTFSSSGSCLQCHPDCATCSGQSFSQCSSCSPSRPVLTNGRCLPTCSKSQYFDTATSTCQACDSSCSSCSGPGPKNCLACSSSSQVLRSGYCVSGNCQGSSSVVPGLGVCLSELVQVPNTSGTGTAAPLPSITGLTEPTEITVHRGLSWWQILLMTLGCAFIFVVILWCWRRRARKQREKRTKSFARAKNLDGPRQGWRWKLIRFGERLFGHRKKGLQSELPVAYDRDSIYSSKIPPIEHDIKLRKLAPPKSEPKEPSTKRRETMDDLISAYEYSIHNHAPSAVSSLDSRRKDEYTKRLKARIEQDSHSLYSEVTGSQRLTPEPRQPLKKDPVSMRSSMIGSSAFVPAPARKLATTREGVLVDVDNNSDHQEAVAPALQMSFADNRPDLTDAQAYMMAVRPKIARETGISSQSQSPLPPFHPIPTFTAAPNFPTPIGTTSTGAVPQLTGGSLMPIPVTLTGNGQGTYWLTPIPPMPQSEDKVILQPMHTGASQSSTSSRNPFRKGTY